MAGWQSRLDLYLPKRPSGASDMQQKEGTTQTPWHSKLKWLTNTWLRRPANSFWGQSWHCLQPCLTLPLWGKRWPSTQIKPLRSFNFQESTLATSPAQPLVGQMTIQPSLQFTVTWNPAVRSKSQQSECLKNMWAIHSCSGSKHS